MGIFRRIQDIFSRQTTREKIIEQQFEVIEIAEKLQQNIAIETSVTAVYQQYLTTTSDPEEDIAQECLYFELKHSLLKTLIAQQKQEVENIQANISLLKKALKTEKTESIEDAIYDAINKLSLTRYNVRAIEKHYHEWFIIANYWDVEVIKVLNTYNKDCLNYTYAERNKAVEKVNHYKQMQAYELLECHRYGLKIKLLRKRLYNIRCKRKDNATYDFSGYPAQFLDFDKFAEKVKNCS